jgi:hypothetical protein
MQSKIFSKVTQAQAVMLVKDGFRDIVLAAAEKYRVDSSLIAAILVDEIFRVNFWDRLQDFIAGRIIRTRGRVQQFVIRLWQYFSREDIGTQSFGLAQMNVNTLRELIREGYLDPPADYLEDQLDTVLQVLEEDALAPWLVGAQVRRTIDHWQQTGVDISQHLAVCGTLYSIGLTGARGVHPHPEPNRRGLNIAEMARQLRIKY